MIFILHLHYKIILSVLKVCATRAGRGEDGKKKGKMNIKLYYIILYIILYIYIFINIVPLCTNATPFFSGVLFFLIVRVEAVFAFPRLPHPLSPSHKFSITLQTTNVYPTKSNT